MQRRSYFRNPVLPWLLLAPQLIVTLIFFIWPAFLALKTSFFRGDVFGIQSHFVWFANFTDLFSDSVYLHSLLVTLVFSCCVTLVSVGAGLVMAVFSDQLIRGAQFYRTLLIWPYAVAPAVAGLLWRFLFNPAIGVLAFALAKLGYQWNYLINAHQAMFLVVIAAAWQQFSYNFIFFLAGLQAIPKSILDAAAMDGAGSLRRFFSIVFPLLSPTTFYLIIMNLIYAFFETFGIVQIVTQGGPAEATNFLVFKVFNDGFMGLDLGGSSAQSVILMIVVIGLTILQFRYIERRVHYV